MSEGFEATKIAGNALNALSPIDDGDDNVNDGNCEGEKQVTTTKTKDLNESEEDEELLL